MKSDTSGNVLVVDDDKDVLYTAKLVLRGLFDRVDTLDQPALIPEYLKKSRYELILLDMNFARGVTTGKEGLEWLDKILSIDPAACVVVTTAYGEINLAVQAMKHGATDFVSKPWNSAQLVSFVTNVIRARLNEKKAKTRNGSSNSEISIYPEIISRSEAMLKIKETIKTVAPTDANVLILGESGTGKELVAWSLHNQSLRSRKPFIHVDLGSVPETLFESELFGHTRGAFTDAKDERAGRFEAASGGTLFLDEIGNLSLPLQAKILTAIQKRAVVRIGSNDSRPVNVRVISATNMPLYEMADSLAFRQDLLYRINTIEIVIPPLRDRKDDIEIIADHYLKVFSGQYGKQTNKLGSETLRKLKEYHWPGNIRELAHTIERAVIFSKNGDISTVDFKFRAKQESFHEEGIISIEDFEKKAISLAMNKHNGNLSKAAEEMGMARSTLYRKIAKFGIEN